VMINYAHRGASTYYPENTLSAFYAGVDMGANGIETDVQKTKDGVLVLFHDDTVDRVTNGTGAVSDHTYAELLELTVSNGEYGRNDKITTFEDFLRYFGWRDLTFAIELKQKETEKEVIAMLDKYGMREKTIITSFDFENLVRVKQIAPEYKVGYLYGPDVKDAPEKLAGIGGEQLCPKAETITPEMVEKFRGMGYSVRAWGVKNEEIMAYAVHCNVDGMTVNFPDKLNTLLKNA